ncbi:PRC-barrel domain-containing protein [Marininema mesophilum]|uniref:PRC-barrel domain-containing protein n=1 Tax=Marininema mesophilum TaxID=1048340 RepID=A0A1H2YC96_9BACL|nr:PRC-barrel domain-containing protein [Marininema mesophilum]SDX02595.1 PRC-barrel domain-containing protein [Marininema mesophilum]
MLVSAKGIEGTTVSAVDGEIGKVDGFWMDDEKWTLRYLVVDVGTLFSRQRVLISPIAIDKVDWEQQQVILSLSEEQVKNSPEVDADQPLSRRTETDLHRHYGWPTYWGGAGLWGGGMIPGELLSSTYSVERENRSSPPNDFDHMENGLDDSRLLSLRALIGYTLKTHDGELGQVNDFIIDDHSWSVHYLVADAGNWLSSKKVMIEKSSIQRVNSADAHIHVDLVKDNVKGSPEFDPSDPVNGDRYDYYGRPQ